MRLRRRKTQVDIPGIIRSMAPRDEAGHNANQAAARAADDGTLFVEADSGLPVLRQDTSVLVPVPGVRVGRHAVQ